MIFSFHPEADKEFREAIEYYETCQRSLGEDFYFEVHSTIDRIAGFPQTWPVLEGDIRRCLVHRFPYGVLYSKAVRGVTAARYAKAANIVAIDPEVLDVFPDGSAVNEALRALVPVLRRQRVGRVKKRAVA